MEQENPSYLLSSNLSGINLDQLPPELLNEICSYLPTKDRHSLMLTSSFFYRGVMIKKRQGYHFMSFVPLVIDLVFSDTRIRRAYKKSVIELCKKFLLNPVCGCTADIREILEKGMRKEIVKCFFYGVSILRPSIRRVLLIKAINKQENGLAFLFSIHEGWNPFNQETGTVKKIRSMIRSLPHFAPSSSLKVVMIPAGHMVGQRSIVEGKMRDNSDAAIGYGIYSNLYSGLKYQWWVVALASVERYRARSLLVKYYKGASLVIFTCSFHDLPTGECLQRRIKDIELYSPVDIRFFLVINAVDIYNEKKHSDKLVKIHNYCLQNNIEYVLCSIKTGEGLPDFWGMLFKYSILKQKNQE